MSNYKVTDTELASVANAIRTKGGTSAQLEWPTGFVNAIGDISGGGDIVRYDSADDTLTFVFTPTSAKVYFNGFSKGANNVSIPPELPLLACNTSGNLYVRTIAYDSDKETQIGWIGFYVDTIRTISLDEDSTISGTFWGVLDITNIACFDGDMKQQNPYTAPPGQKNVLTDVYRFYNADGTNLIKVEYVSKGSHSSNTGQWASQPNGTTPVDLSVIETSSDLYMIQPPNYHESNDGKVGVLVYQDYKVLFFMNYSKSAADTNLPSELAEYISVGASVVQAYAYGIEGGYMANIGSYNNAIRSWGKDNTYTIAVDNICGAIEYPVQSGTPTVSIGGTLCQAVPYTDPSSYYIDHL